MIKWEKKLVDFLEKHMLLLAALFLSGIALLMRRQNIWFYTDDYIYYFDMHDKSTQSALYYLMVRLVSYVFEIPLHGIKWIAGLSDFAVALLSVIFCVKSCDIQVLREKEVTVEKIKILLLYAACLFAPVVYLRGCVWARIDSLGFAFLLGAACARKYLAKRGVVTAIVLSAIGVALYPPFLVVVILWCLCLKKQEVRCEKYFWLMVAGIAMIFEIISALVLGMPWRQGCFSFINWIIYHPHTGIIYESISSWIWQQLLVFSYGAAVLTLIAAFRKKLPLFPVIGLQIVLAVCFSITLGW